MLVLHYVQPEIERLLITVMPWLIEMDTTPQNGKLD